MRRGGVLILPLLLVATTLSQKLTAIVEAKALSAAYWGIEVKDLRTGTVLFARNPDKLFQPASTLKLLTTAAALDALGKDDQIETTVETPALLDAGGDLRGDAFLVGRGDPNLSSNASPDPRSALVELAEGLSRSGVRRILGRVVGHEGYFRGERRGPGWSWEDLVWWYGAEVSALSFNDNCASLEVSPGSSVGEPVSVRATLSRYFTLVSTATTSEAAAKSDLVLERPLGHNRISLSGSAPLGAAPSLLQVALEDPALYAATVFAEILESRGIRVEGGVSTSSEALPAGSRALATHVGAPLGEVLKGINKPSQNLHAEMLLRVLGAKRKGEGSADKGLEAARDFLAAHDLDATKWSVEDGSGLSSHDLVTPRGLVDLLVVMHHHPLRDVFRESLPIAGVDGSLRGRMKGTAAEGVVWAKTGGLHHTHSVAGYARRRSGGEVAFAFLLNNDASPPGTARAALDALVVALAGS